MLNPTRYNVCFECLVDSHRGVRTWTTFDSKADFDTWFDAEMRARDRVVEEGISAERAVELCMVPSADAAVLRANTLEIIQILG